MGESNMRHVGIAGDHKVLLPNKLLSVYIYSTDRLSEAGFGVLLTEY